MCTINSSPIYLVNQAICKFILNMWSNEISDLVKYIRLEKASLFYFCYQFNFGIEYAERVIRT